MFNQFPYDAELIKKVRDIELLPWRMSKKMWYINEKEFELNPFFNHFKNQTYFDYTELSKNMPELD